MNSLRGEETIFAEALRLPPEERAAYLAQATHGNAELRLRVESLLGSYGTGDFLEQAAAPELRPTLTMTVAVTEKAGDTIGRYKLREQIGEGGCGIVYVAEQTEPVRRRVALKIIKLGMDTRSVIARFEAERQALALMDHPNIAKVLDAGATKTGRPYFVMELVRGTKITEYCDEKKLSTRARLDLFIQVCRAIQHAHQKGIIHRDIKPSNILVTVNDGVPVPKVIDFGIAKATSGQQLTDKTIYTAFEQFIGTPAYMSPEQAVLTSLDIDTRSDIYALGVLLYELLTGKTPFDAKELLAIGLDEMRRTIREQEPPRPSTRLSTLPGQELSTTAQRRGLDAPKLVSELRGDLDWIAMKALEKDRARRYETANGLAADIQRHLNNEPVVARPPSRIYRLRKMVRRNKLAFAAAAAIGMALVMGTVVSAWQAQRAHRAEQVAKAAAARAQDSERAAKEEKDSAEAVLQFVRDKVLAAGRPEGMGGGVGKDVTLREAIDRAESKISEAFTNRPLVEAAVRKTLGESYLYLGEPTLAIPQLERALAVRREKLGLENKHTVGTMTKLRQAYRDAGQPFEFLPFYEEALKMSEARWGSDHTNTISVMDELATAYQDAGKFDQALPLLKETLRLRKAHLGMDHRDTLLNMGNVAWAYKKARRVDQAIALYNETLDLWTAKRGPEYGETLATMNNLAVVYWEAGKVDKARLLFEEALQLRKKTKPEHHDTLITMYNLAGVYKDEGKFEKAISLFEETLKLRIATVGPDHAETLTVRKGLAGAYAAAGKFDEAEALYEETLKLMTATLGRTNRLTLDLMNQLGLAYGYDTTGKKLVKAIPLLEETVKLRKAEPVPDQAATLASMDNLARAYARAGHFDDALSLLHEIESRQGIDHPRTLSIMSYIAFRYTREGKFDQALSLSEQAFNLAKAKLGLEHSETRFYMFGLARAYVDAGKTNQALPILEEAKTTIPKLKLEDPAILKWMNNVGVVYLDASKPEQAIPIFREILKVGRAIPGLKDSDTLLTMNNLAAAYIGAGKPEQAITLCEEALNLANAKLGPKHGTTRLIAKQAAYANGALRQTLTERGDLEQLDALLPRHVEHALALLPSNDPVLAAMLATLALDLLHREKFVEAERLASESLAIREKNEPDDWRTFNSRSVLGRSLLGQKKYAEAEPLLLSGFNGMMQREEKIPSLGRPRLKETLQCLVQLYEATGRAEDAAPWKQKLAEFEQKEERRTAMAREAQSKDSSSKTNHPPK